MAQFHLPNPQTKALLRKPIGLWVLVLLVLSACSSPPVEKAAPAPQPGKCVVSGRVTNIQDYWQETSLSVYLADYYENVSGKGFFTLDAYAEPAGQVDEDGWFVLADLTPANYVLVVGPSPEESHLVIGEDEQVLVLRLSADQSLDLGEIRLK